MAAREISHYSYIAPIPNSDDYEASWGDPPGPFNRLEPAIARAESNPTQHVAIMTKLREVVEEVGFSRENAPQLLGKAARLAAERNWRWEQEQIDKLELGDVVKVEPWRVLASDGFDTLPVLVVNINSLGSFEGSAIAGYESEREVTGMHGSISTKNVIARIGHVEAERVAGMYRNSIHPRIDPIEADRRTEKFLQVWLARATSPKNA